MLVQGVREGRTTFANTLKYVFMATSANFGNMFSMAAASLFLPFLPMLPLQILLNNFLYDLSQGPIPSDRVDETYMQKPMAFRPHPWHGIDAGAATVMRSSSREPFQPKLWLVTRPAAPGCPPGPRAGSRPAWCPR